MSYETFGAIKVYHIISVHTCLAFNHLQNSGELCGF